MGQDFSKADKGKTFKRGGDMVAKMGKFEKMGKDVEKRGMKEGSAKDMAMDRMQMMKKGGGVKKMASGGSASSRADGIATKGKTKGKMIKMNMGGKAC